ncbi:hypothetical protein B0H16DRAFT_1464920 [Mycena metata]|uniref:Uncharacterized protein n=1 Tax=Mycena metata TaxID=1033252 RepID=A0AAD7ID20_9AGAR|nr:hypothetical protein B0H16DRAFT_1464920 [Mycena metata]
MIVLKLLCASKPKLQLLTTVIFCGRSEAAPVPPVTVLPAKAQSAVFRSDTGSIHSSCRRCFVWFTIFVVKEMGQESVQALRAERTQDVAKFSERVKQCGIAIVSGSTPTAA